MNCDFYEGIMENIDFTNQNKQSQMLKAQSKKLVPSVANKPLRLFIGQC